MAREPERGVLIAGLLAGDVALLAQAGAALGELLGPVERVSAVWPFGNTAYYADELGAEIHRQFVTFAE
ncbi:MAG: DUF4416 family protein, partial [Phycisphaerales bacterium]|nr:DUF4416 family protein [Phycisphaerales bacterium]